MDIIKLLLIFTGIIIVIKYNKPLYMALLVGIIITIGLYRIGPSDSVQLILKGTFSRDTIYLVLAFYSITFLQRMLEKRKRIMLAEQSLDNLFNSRRVNAMVAPFIIGLLPSPGAVLIAAPIVDNAAGEYITKEERTFVTSYFRHISESFLPTYSHILLALSLTSIDMTAFVVAMLPMVAVLFLLGYFVYVRKIPKGGGNTKKIDKKLEVKNLVTSLWSIALTITIVLTLKIPVHLAVAPVIILNIIVDKFKIKEILPMFRSAFELNLIVTTVLIMIFKEALTFTGVIERLPGYFELLPISPVIIFALIFFFGTIVAGSKAIIALTLPLAFATVPTGGLSLMILLMSISYIAMQISPTHICLAIITEHYGTSFIDLVKKTMPVLISFLIITSIYSFILSVLF
ncbi:MAG: DUF401 family protein [Tissierellia bacterium]|jgi:integral membrane protein (TIGR00529 family)|nr:DUF401 family protein [Tissierellia bacterium]